MKILNGEWKILKIEFYAILNYPGSNITPLVGEMFAVIMMGPEDLFQFGRKTAEKCKESWRQRFFDRVNLNAIRAREVEVISLYV